jgi:hypothetical protein
VLFVILSEVVAVTFTDSVGSLTEMKQYHGGVIHDIWFQPNSDQVSHSVIPQS